MMTLCKRQRGQQPSSKVFDCYMMTVFPYSHQMASYEMRHSGDTVTIIQW